MLALVGIAAIVVGQTNEIAAIDALVESANKFSESNPKAKKMVMLQQGQWVKMLTDSDHLDGDQMAKEDVEAVVFAWARGGRTELVNFSYPSQSGDNFVYLTTIYRADRSLAFAEYHYSGFSPMEGRVSRKNYYSPDGGVLKSTTSWTDLDGKKLSASVIRENSSWIAELFFDMPAYPNIRMAPYVDLLAQ